MCCSCVQLIYEHLYSQEVVAENIMNIIYIFTYVI